VNGLTTNAGTTKKSKQNAYPFSDIRSLYIENY